MRKLASIRQISEIKVHPNADAIELAMVDGWQCVVKKGEFIPGDVVVYFEVDSVLPVREEYEFLRKGCYRKADWLPEGEGFRLRTIKLRGEYSQGLLLHLGSIDVPWQNEHKTPGVDVTEFLGVVKWDPPLPACLSGQAKGNFPAFIPKTDQERAQNITREIASAAAAGDRFEATIKLDGSSCTMFFNEGEVGVCSRNLQLKDNEENADNTFVRLFNETGIKAFLNQLGINIAIQGELMGPGIQGNREGFNEVRFFVYDGYDIDAQEYLLPEAREQFFDTIMIPSGVKAYHVPVIFKDAVLPPTVDELLEWAEGPSIKNPIREGLVFKHCKGGFSFKVISNKFLLGEE